MQEKTTDGPRCTQILLTRVCLTLQLLPVSVAPAMSEKIQKVRSARNVSAGRSPIISISTEPIRRSNSGASNTAAASAGSQRQRGMALKAWYRGGCMFGLALAVLLSCVLPATADIFMVTPTNGPYAGGNVVRLLRVSPRSPPLGTLELAFGRPIAQAHRNDRQEVPRTSRLCPDRTTDGRSYRSSSAEAFCGDTNDIGSRWAYSPGADQPRR
jgi:hypothetical protein